MSPVAPTLWLRNMVLVFVVAWFWRIEAHPELPAHDHRVVVLHSYHFGFSWSDSISQGIRSEFASRLRQAEVKFEFLDTRFNATEAYLDALRLELQAKYANRRVDVVIACDDHALNFMAQNGSDVFPGAPVVFCSVSGYREELHDRMALTGLRESIDIRATIQTALRLHPQTRELVVILDRSRTGRALKEKTQAVLAGLSSPVEVRYLEDYTVEQLKTKLPHLGDHIVILLFIFRPDESGRVRSHEENLERIRPFCPYPIYAVWDFYLGHGIVGGRLTNGVEEGRMAARMAMRILGGEAASDIELEQSPVRFAFDCDELTRFGIHPSDLPQGSDVIREPFSFFDTYRHLIAIVSGVFVLMLAIIGFLVFNIVARRRAQSILRENEEDLRITLNSVGDAVVATNLEGEIVRLNPVAEALTGWRKEEARRRRFSEVFQLLDAHSRQPVDDPVAMVIKYGKIVGLGDHAILVSKSGQEYQVTDSAAPIKAVDGTISGVVLVFRDVTGEHEKDRRLRESEDQYRLVVENANDAIFVAQDGRLKFVNEKTTEILGYDSEAIKSMDFLEFIHPDDRERVMDRHIRRLRGEQGLPETYSFRVINQDGGEITLQLNAVVITWEGRLATLNFGRDVTELIKLQASLNQAQKMEAIGTLAGGIAHDFNNLLMGIQGRASIMSLDFEPGNPAHQHVQAIEEYVKSATDLTNQLLGLARGGKYEVRAVDINEVLSHSASMFGRTRKEIRIHTKLDDPAPIVSADRRQIEQVFLNVFVNAWQAMPKGGELYLETRCVTVDEEFGKSHRVSPGPYARISITDTGIGMDESVRSRVFDPFFTTKEKGRGTGLGLSSAYGIIQNHQGAITVYSEVGRGSSFNIYLPVSDQAAKSDTGDYPALKHGSETVLLVDDEELVSDVAREMLERLGYRVLIASHGDSAVELIEKKGDDIHLVILDMIMPGMDGGQVFDRIRKLQPDLPIILSSGYSRNGQADDIMKRGCDGFIQKPVNIADLSKKIRDTLDGPRNALD